MVCSLFELLYFLKYDVLSEYPTTFMFAALLNEYELVFTFKSFAIDESGTLTGVNARTGVLFV